MMIGIIYSAGQKVRRRMCVTDSEASLQSFKKTGRDPGEVFIEMPEADYLTRNPDEWLAEKVGPRGKDRCVEVDSQGRAVRVFLGDPQIDAPRGAGHTLELHDHARVGDQKVNGRFTRQADPVEPDPPGGA